MTSAGTIQGLEEFKEIRYSFCLHSIRINTVVHVHVCPDYIIMYRYNIYKALGKQGMCYGVLSCKL